MLGDDGSHHIQIEAGVFMHGHVSKTDHSLHAVGKISRKNTRGLQKRKCITALLWHAELPVTDGIHGKIDRGFARALKIQDNGVLLGLILNKIPVGTSVFFFNATNTPFDACGLVEDDIISHR